MGHTQTMGVVVPRALLVKILRNHHWIQHYPPGYHKCEIILYNEDTVPLILEGIVSPTNFASQRLLTS